jgi:hypothetical protein
MDITIWYLYYLLYLIVLWSGMSSVKDIIRNIHSKYEKSYLKEMENINFDDNV